MQLSLRRGSSTTAPLISIASIGALALRLLEQHADWTVAATFDRSFYIRSGPEFICVGDASIGDGPLNALLAEPEHNQKCHPRAWPEDPATNYLEMRNHHPQRAATTSQRSTPAEPWVLGPSPRMTLEGGGDGDRQAASSRKIALPDGRILSWCEARIWQATACPQISPEALRVGRLEMIIAAACDAAPEASFVHALSSKPSDDLLARRAREGMTSLGNALRDPTVETCEAAAQRLLGLGHGLTPSGDDVLSGALIMLAALNRPETAMALSSAIQLHMDTATSPLSCAFLRAACDGEPSAALQHTIALLLNGAAPSQVVAPARQVGHASGFDMLAGILVAAAARAS